ncbi:MAG: AAA family ATPase [Acidimicrobiales bacterium]
MFLKSLSLKGFKSFADPAVLEFEPGVTVVVGPNGSGKSNVVDAVAWVLGAQGPRMVRSSKMEDVIFAGTSDRPSLGRAEVSLTIDNAAGKLPSDLAEITITRTLFRSGDSEYSINGAACRLLDVQELLSDTGVGRQQHVIISQGNLDAILEARSEDRRAVIEEAAGVLKFRRRRERSERRLASTEENLERLYDLVREVKRQIRPLERQAATARSHAGLAEQRRAVRLFGAGCELASLDARRSEATELRKQLTATEADYRGQLDELDAHAARTSSELSLQRQSDLVATIGRTEGLVERSRGLANVLRERRRSLDQALDAAADADVVSTLEAEAANLVEELAATEAEALRLAPEHDAVVAAEATAAAELGDHLEAWGDGDELRRAEEAVTVARGQLASLEHALERDRRSLDQMTARTTALERRSSLLEGEAHELAERLAELEQERHVRQAAVATTEDAHRRASRRLEVAEEALRQADQERHRSAARADALERVLEEARGAAGAELLTDLDGVIGTLLDLVEVDDGWEDAFEAAVGSSVAAVVVRGRGAAKAALTRLHQGKAPGVLLSLVASAQSVGERATTGTGPEWRSTHGSDGPGVPSGADPVRAHVRVRRGATGDEMLRSGAVVAVPDGLDSLLDTLLAGALCVRGSWSDAIDLSLERPDLTVVTRSGDRFSSAGWRVRAAGGVVTAAVVDEARARAAAAAAVAAEQSSERRAAQIGLEAARAQAADAVRADDRHELAHQTARAAHLRVTGDRDAVVGELEDARQDRAALEDRIAQDAARAGALAERQPLLESTRAELAQQAAQARAERLRIDERLAAAALLRNQWEVRSAGLDERRRVLSERRAEVERRLSGHADERQQAAERRERLQRDATAVDRLTAAVTVTGTELDQLQMALRARHERQIEAVRVGGARLEELGRRRAELDHEVAAVRGRLQGIEVDLVEVTVRREAVVEALAREVGCGPSEALTAPAPDLPAGTDLTERVAQLDAELAALGPVNPLALEELSELNERVQFLETQVDDVRTARRELHQVIRTLDEEIMRVFTAAFADVNEHFSELIAALFPGGAGRLTLTDPERLLDTGVEIEARPAGRNIRRLSLLSGGERSLVALAYLFAVFRSRPSPFYLMDEVEAALDDVNLQRFLELVREFRDGAQLIIVSHQKRTMEAADALYGVAMAPGGSSRVVSQRMTGGRPDQGGDFDGGFGPGREPGPRPERVGGGEQ